MSDKLHVFDFDEVIVDEYWFEHVNNHLVKLGREPIASINQLKDRFYPETEVFTDPAELQGFLDYFRKQEPYKGMSPRPKCARVLERLNLRDNVLIATAMPNELGREYVLKEMTAKKRFVQRELPFLNTENQLLFTNDKRLLSGYSMTDDVLHNLDGEFSKKLYYTAHHNKYFTPIDQDIIRVENWQEIGEVLNVL